MRPSRRGPTIIIPKPFTPGELRTRVNRGLEKRSLLQEARKLREERERNLLELANEKSRTQTIIQCMGDGLLVTNRDRRVVFCNPGGTTPFESQAPCIRWGSRLINVARCPEFIDLVESTMNLEGRSGDDFQRNLPRTLLRTQCSWPTARR